MTSPRPVRPGDCVRIVGVSGAVRTAMGQSVERAAERVRSLGFRVQVDASAHAQYGYLSGTDRERAGALMRAFTDPGVDAVLCMKGGYGTPRILDRLDYAAIRESRRAFIGYSDITALHAAIQGRAELCTFHGPMAVSDALSDDAPTRKSLLRALAGEGGPLQNPDSAPLARLRGGQGRGELVGGNLSLVAALTGTPYELDTRGRILFLEDIGEKTYSVDRLLTQLRLAGKLSCCAGIVLGQFTDCEVEYPDYGLTLPQVFEDLLPPDVPAVRGLTAGHCTPNLTLPLGRACALDADAGTLTVL